MHTSLWLRGSADTGIVYGFLTPLLAMARTRGLDVDCRPMFLDRGWNATVKCNASRSSSVGAGGGALHSSYRPR